MSIPGYIDYFVNGLEEERKRTDHLPYGVGDRATFPAFRFQYIRDTLPHLPAPPTIRALGEYLYDERDTPPPPKPGQLQSWRGLHNNAIIASNALTRIGLIDPPRYNLKAQKKWWEQIKAGKRWFAFHGQSVSYRFRSDGTFETKPRDASGDPQWVVEVRTFDFFPEKLSEK